MWLALGLVLAPRQEAATPRTDVVVAERPAHVRVLEGPIVLHAAIDLQWGGHTYSYLVEGERGIFWTAKKVGAAGAPLIGQHPKHGSSLEPRVHEFAITGDVVRTNQPFVMRTPDGHLHAFVGSTVKTGDREPGRLHYFRSARPEEVNEFVDRTECLPTDAYSQFHLRTNAGISRDGTRIALAILTDFVPGKHSINVPLVFLGRREGLDFRFDAPIAWSEVTPFFYPQVAVTDTGPVLVGAVDADPSRRAELVHLDWDGSVLFRHTLPSPDVVAQSWAFEIEPIDPGDWSKLMIVRSITPSEGTQRAIEFWSYDALKRALARVRAFENDIEKASAFSNAGQIIAMRARAPLFINEPSSRVLSAWEGDLLGSGTMRVAALPGTDPTQLGYSSIRSIFVPGLLQGSVSCDGTRYVAMDVSLADLPKGATGPCSFLAWRIEVGEAR